MTEINRDEARGRGGGTVTRDWYGTSCIDTERRELSDRHSAFVKLWKGSRVRVYARGDDEEDEPEGVDGGVVSIETIPRVGLGLSVGVGANDFV